MNCIKQSATNEICIETGMELKELKSIEAVLFQDGQELLRRTGDECVMDGSSLSFRLESWESARLSPARFLIQLLAEDGENRYISESIEGCVERSEIR